jgi:hypothetical protein
LKGEAKIDGNPDVEVCSSCGEVFPQTSDGGLGGREIGNENKVRLYARRKSNASCVLDSAPGAGLCLGSWLLLYLDPAQRLCRADDDFNLYAYARNDPLKIDPFGEQACDNQTDCIEATNFYPIESYRLAG